MHAKTILLAMVVAELIPGLMCKAQSNTSVETFPASLATNNPETFILRPGGKYIRNPDTDRFWRLGVWKEMTNGWRVLLYVSTNTPYMSGVTVGSKVTNSGSGYLKPPYGKFAKFELLNSSGKVVQPKQNAGTNMLKGYYHDLASQTNLPAWASPTNGSLAVDFPELTTADVFPRQYSLSGPIVGDFSFSTKIGPMPVSLFALGDLYTITNEGDYTLTVQPVLYKRGSEANVTDQFGYKYSDIFHRVDLPSITAKVHLKPAP